MKSFRKSGGGFLNGVDATITGYEYTDEFNGKPFVAGKKPNGEPRFHSLYCRLDTRVAGAVEDASTSLFMGGFEDWTVDEGGHTLSQINEDDPRVLGNGTGYSYFIESLVAAEPRIEAVLGDDYDAGYDLTSLIGLRVRFVQQVDVEATKKAGKAKNKEGVPTYDRKNLVVEAVYELPKSGKKASGKAAGTTSATGKGKAAQAAADAPDADVESLAKDTLQSIVVASGGTIDKTKLNMALLKSLLKRKDLDQAVRESVRQLAFSNAFLESCDGIVFDAVGGTIALAD